MSEWLRGTADRVALAFGGDAVRYGELARAVDAACSRQGPARSDAAPAPIPSTS